MLSLCHFVTQKSDYGNSDIEAADRRGSRDIKEERPVLCSDDVRAVCDTEEASMLQRKTARDAACVWGEVRKQRDG